MTPPIYGWNFGQYAAALQRTADRWLSEGKVVYCLIEAGPYAPEPHPEIVAWLNQYGLLVENELLVQQWHKQGQEFTSLMRGPLYVRNQELNLAPSIHIPYTAEKRRHAPKQKAVIAPKAAAQLTLFDDF